MPNREKNLKLSALLIVLYLASARAPAAAQGAELPGGRTIADLELTQDYVCELDGEALEQAELYFSKRQVAYLLIAPELESTLLISPRGESVQAVSLAKVAKSAGIEATLGGDAVTEYLGRYETSHGVMSFQLDGRTVRLVPREPMLGAHTFGAVEERHPRYAKAAKAVLPESAGRAELKALPESKVRIRLYFASWSPICKRLVPKVMQLERELNGKIVVDYYGLPNPLSADPIVKEEGIHSVPTAVVYLYGEEIGRLTGRELDKPGEALQRLLEAHP